MEVFLGRRRELPVSTDLLILGGHMKEKPEDA
jgi:hypothetical protein